MTNQHHGHHHHHHKAEHHKKMAEEMKQRLKVDELEENIGDLKDVAEDVFPILIITVFVSVIILLLFLYRMYMRWHVDNPSKNRLDGKTVLITGATSGIGKAAAVDLAKRNARVLVTGREKSIVEAVARNIRKKTGNQHVNALVLDLANIRSIREFAEDFNKNEKSLHILINNGGYMGPKAVTDDGLERTFGVNYLGHFYLTYLLADKLKRNAPSRVINVVSDTYMQGSLDLDDLAMNKGYDPMQAFHRSKFAQCLFIQECHRRLFPDCICTYGACPGPTNTELFRSYPGLKGNILRVFSRFMFKPPEDGCQTVVYCAVADGLREFSGKIFANCKVLKTSSKIKDKDRSEKLWEISCRLCGFEDKRDQDAPEKKPEEKKAE